MRSTGRLTLAFTAVLLAVFVGVTLGPALLGHGVLADVGMLTRYPPFNADHITAGTIWCRADTIDSVLPAMAQIQDGLRHGDLVTWSPYEVGGGQLAALPQYQILNPTMWPFAVLPLWYAPAVSTLLQWAVAVGGMVAFLGRFGVSRGAAAVAGVAFATCGFMVMWHNWPHVAVACFIPLLFWAVDRAVTQPSPRGVAWLGIVVACMLLGGFPAVTMFAMTAVAVFALARLIGVGRGAGARAVVRGVVTAGCGVVLGVGLSAVQMVPFVRDLGSIGLDTRDFTQQTLPWPHFLTTVAPGAYGTCAGGNGFGAVNVVEATAFAGAAVVALGLYAVTARPSRRWGVPRWILGAILLVALVAIWRGGVVLTALQHLPLYSSNRIGRATSVTGFLLAALAGLGLDRLLRPAAEPGDPPDAADPGDDHAPDVTSRLRGLAWPALAAGAALLVAALGWSTWSAGRALAERQGHLDTFDSATRLAALFTVLAIAGLAVAVLTKGRPRQLAALGLAALVVAQSTLFARTMLPPNSRDDFYPQTQTHRFLEEHLGGERFASVDNVLYPATADYYRLRTPVGHQFTQPTWRDLLERIDPNAMLSATYSVLHRTAGRADQPLLDALSVRYWVGGPGDVTGSVAYAPGSEARGTVEAAEGQRLTCTVPQGRARGIVATLPEDLALGAHQVAQVHVRVSGGDADIEGRRSIPGPLLKQGELRVALPGDLDLPEPARVELWFTGVSEPVSLAADGEGAARCGVVRPDDGLRLVDVSPGALVYERPHWLPRIRWAGTSKVVASRSARLRQLARGVGSDTVLLDDDRTPAASGSTAQVDVTQDEAERISADVTASGEGYLVVADAIARDGWTATVDGRPAPIVAADHALAAVPVPAGSHRVSLSYDAPGLRTGAMITLASAVATIVLLLLPMLRRPRRGRTT